MKAFGVLLATAVAVSEASIGDEFFRSFTEYVPMPMNKTQALRDGWVITDSSCVPGLGFPMRVPHTKQNTTLLYFDARGAISGISVDVFGTPPPQKLIDLGYWAQVSHDRYRISLGYRDASLVCSTTAGAPEYSVGDRVVINPSGVNQSIPLTREAAEGENWYKGSCFYGMGHHWYKDLEGHGNMTWQAENLMPVVAMYNDQGKLQANFFASWTVQQHLLSGTNDWEPIPLPTHLMCENFCSPDCHFAGTSIWSTYHVYYNPLQNATCADNCQVACCP